MEPGASEGGGSVGDFFDVIPAFTVLKKGAAIKNIFLHCPISPRSWPSSESATADSGGGGGATSPTSSGVRFLVGRHPDCHVVLDHPSVSRFHLELLARPVSRRLTVTDLSSVHGTWICGRRLEPRQPVELQEGDVLKFGASTRVYILRWVALGGTDGRSNPLALGPLPEEDKTDEEETLEAAVVVTDKVQQTNYENKNFLVEYPNHLQAEPKVLLAPLLSEPVLISSSDGFRSLPSSEEEEETERNLRQEEEMVPSEEEETECELRQEEELVPQKEDEEVTEPTKEEEGQPRTVCDNANWRKEELIAMVLVEIPNFLQDEPVVPSAPLMPESLALSSLDGSPWPLEQDSTWSRKTLRVEEEVAPQKGEVEDQPLLFSPQRLDTNVLSSGLLSRRSRSASLLRVRTGRSSEKSNGLGKVLFPEEKEPRNEEGKGEEGEGEDSYPSDKENLTPASHPSRKLKRTIREPSALRYASDSNQTPSVDKENCVQVGLLSEKTGNASSNSKLQKNILSSRRILKSNKVDSDKENGKPEPPSGLKVQPKKLFTEQSYLTDEETFTPDKENRTPKPPSSSRCKDPSSSNRRQRIESVILKKRAGERVPFQSLLSSPLTKPSPLCSSNAENSPAIDSGVGKEISAGRKGERVPFQTLLDKSARKPEHISVDNASSQIIKAPSFVTSCNSKVKKTVFTVAHPCYMHISSVLENDTIPRIFLQRKKKWSIVVDVGCLTDEESLRSLQLLEGIRGTSLVIPKMVIRELDYLKRTESIFRKTASRASAILQWIEDCMEKTSWWIHVQSSGEMAPAAPTPPVTPRSGLDERSQEGMMMISSCAKPSSHTGWGRRSSSVGLAEIVSPTAEDHILDCALLFRSMRADEQTVLLTKSVSLKIKAMAEGLLCETAKDFRESLVNPCSERFLWVDSSPRGPTWSLAEEAAAMVENHHHQLLLPPTPAARRGAAGAGGGGKPTTEGAKGLKLILLHNSHYGHLNTVR